ncbi:MAG: amidohydrolase family protein [Gemmatimonadales bacterium]
MITRRTTELARLLLIGVTALSCAKPVKDRIALVGVTIIDGTDAPAREDQVVILKGSKIDTIAPTAGFEIPKSAMVIDLKGKWLMPGLIDADGEVRRWAVTRYLAFGVTAVRDIGNDQDSILALAEEASLHSLVSPRLYVSGAALDGIPPFDPSSTPLANEAAARRAVDDRAQAGTSFISTGPGMAIGLLRGAADEAANLNTSVSARLGLTDARTAARSGVKAQVELSGVPQAAINPEPFYAAFRKSPWAGWTAVERSWAGLDSTALTAVARDLASAGATLVPALSMHDTWSRLDDPAVTGGEDLAYVPESAKDAWDLTGFETRAGWDASTYPQFRAGRIKQDLFVREFRLAGGRVAAGTGASRPMLVPGASLHREMELLVGAGLPPDDVIRAATSNAAALIGADSIGTVAPGKVADLLVLDADPRADIRNTRKISRVILGGVILDADSLARRARQ